MPTTTNVHTARVFEDELNVNLEASGWAIKAHPKYAPSYKKVTKESIIFPRFHQLVAVKELLTVAAMEGPGLSYTDSGSRL